MPSAIPVASTKMGTIVRFSVAKRDRYRFSEKNYSDCLPSVEDSKSGHCRLRHQKISISSLREILGIVWDQETVKWGDSLAQLDPDKTFVLVRWKGIKKPVWECASDITRHLPACNEPPWPEIALKQEERFEEVVIGLRTRGNDESGSYVVKGGII
jgi:hypothetical protein